MTIFRLRGIYVVWINNHTYSHVNRLDAIKLALLEEYKLGVIHE